MTLLASLLLLNLFGLAFILCAENPCPSSFLSYLGPRKNAKSVFRQRVTKFDYSILSNSCVLC